MPDRRRIPKSWLGILAGLWILFLVVVLILIVRAVTDPNEVVAEEVAEANGWFTEQQVERGQEGYDQHCAQCHGADLEGEADQPALAGDPFWDRWEGETVHALYQVTRETMPLDDPGGLDDETYADITAYILHFNEFPAGEEELPPEEDRLQQLVIEREVAEEQEEEPEPEEPDPEEPDPEEPEEPEEVEEPDPEEPVEPEQFEITVDPETGAIDVTSPGDAVTLDITAEEDAITVSIRPREPEVPEEPEEPEDPEEPDPEEEPEEEPEDANDNEEPEENEEENQEEPEEPNDNEENDNQENDEANDNEAEADEAWYSEEQAETGHEIYEQHCAQCHGQDLEGDAENPALTGEDFLGRWDTVWELYDYTRETMPQDNPGALEDDEYADVIAYILQENQFPTGEEELPTEQDELEQMQLDPEAAEEPEEPEEPEEEAEEPEEADNELIQAQRGDQAYAQHCARCHGATLEGDVAPALAGPIFLERWGGHPVDWLYFQASVSMPPHNPGMLDDQTYADIIVHMLAETGILDGHEELGADSEEFLQLVIRVEDARQRQLQHRIEALRQVLHAPFEEAPVPIIEPVTPDEEPARPAAPELPEVEEEPEPAQEAPENGEAPNEEPEEEVDEALGPAVQGQLQSLRERMRNLQHHATNN